MVVAALALWTLYLKARPVLLKNTMVFITKNAALSLTMAADDNGGVYPSNLVQLASSQTSAYNAVPPEWHHKWKTFVRPQEFRSHLVPDPLPPFGG